MIDREREAVFKGWGREQLRMRIATSSIPPGWLDDALWWLQHDEDAERRYLEEMETRRFGLQMAEAKRATKVAWISAAAAIAAALLALATLVVTVKW